MATLTLRLVKGSALTYEEADDNWSDINAELGALSGTVAGKQDTLVSGTDIKTINGSSLLGSGNLTVSGGNAVAASLAFGGTFTDKAQTVVTGQAWVAADSKIAAQVLTPSGTDPDELYLLNLRPVISDLVPGTGFTVTLYTEAQARGTYTVNCIGV